MPMIKINKKIKGFSLIETLVATFVLATGLLAAASLIFYSIESSMDSRNQVIAANLAQEGAELVRNIRDNNDPSTPFANLGANPGGCIDYANSSALSSCSFQLNYDNSNHYQYGAGTPTKFFRKIIITAPDAKTLNVASLVSWNGSAPVDVASCTIAKKCAQAVTQITSQN